MDDGLDGAAFLASSIIGSKGFGAGLKGVGMLGKAAINATKVNKLISSENNFFKLMNQMDKVTGKG